MTELIASPTQLPSISEMGSAEANYIQVNAQRQINGSNFRQGVIDYAFSLAGNQRASMKKSYVRMRATIGSPSIVPGGPLIQPSIEDKVAFAENFANNLFSSAYFYIGGVDVSSKQNFCAQSSMARTRLSSTYGWLNSCGKAYGFDTDFSKRAGEISSNGRTQIVFYPEGTGISVLGNVEVVAADGTAEFSNVQNFGIGDIITTIGDQVLRIIGATSELIFLVEGVGAPLVDEGPDTFSYTSITDGISTEFSLEDGKNEIEIIFQPGALGIWESESCLPSGQYRLSLYPVNSDNLTPGIESKNAATQVNDFKIEVTDMYLYLHTYRSVEPIVNGHYFMDLNEMSTQVKTISSPVNNNFNFTIPASTFGIAVWAQAKNAGVNPQLPPSIFDNAQKQLLNLRNVQLTYAGKSAPNTNWDSEFGGQRNWLLQRYHDTYSNAGLSELSHETFDDFLKRGVLLYFEWVKSDDNRSTELQMSIDWSVAGDEFASSTQVFVGSFFRNISRITVDSGYVTSVTKLSI